MNRIQVIGTVALLSLFLANVLHAQPQQPGDAQLFRGMGPYTRAVTTESKQAQQFFNQGLTWLHAFNHDEAIRSFLKAGSLDPNCAMAWWGVAYCEGPNYNDEIMTKLLQSLQACGQLIVFGSMELAPSFLDTFMELLRRNQMTSDNANSSNKDRLVSAAIGNFMRLQTVTYNDLTNAIE